MGTVCLLSFSLPEVNRSFNKDGKKLLPIPVKTIDVSFFSIVETTFLILQICLIGDPNSAFPKYPHNKCYGLTSPLR